MKVLAKETGLMEDLKEIPDQLGNCKSVGPHPYSHSSWETFLFHCKTFKDNVRNSEVRFSLL